MSMNAAEIARIAADLRDIVTGGRLQKIRQPDAHTIVLETRVPGRTVYIIVSARPGLSYVALAEDTPESPPELPAFCALVRKYAQGGGIADVTSVPGDRVARIDAVTSDGKRAIVAELFGRQGDILLLDENDRVLGSLRGRGRVPAGEAYAPPPSRPAREEAVRDFGAGSIALAAGRYFADRAAEREIDDARREIGAFLARARKRTTGYLDKLRRELSAEDDPAVLRDKADHLAANLHAVKPRMDTLAMPRFDGAGDIHIPLDPAVSPQQNLERLYARARRTKKRIEAGRARVGEMETHAARLADFEVRLSGAGDADAIARIRDEMIGQGVIPRPRVKRSAAPVRAKRRDKEASRAARRFTSHDGLEILVGKSASDNDEVTFRLARGNDWWFHVQGHGGSHVIARARKEGDLPTETLLDAASLAVMHSKLSRQGAGEVLYTRRKNVRKRKGAPPGQVTAEHTRTIFVRIEKARIDRLFAGSGQGET